MLSSSSPHPSNPDVSGLTETLPLYSHPWNCAMGRASEWMNDSLMNIAQRAIQKQENSDNNLSAVTNHLDLIYTIYKEGIQLINPRKMPMAMTKRSANLNDNSRRIAVLLSNLP